MCTEGHTENLDRQPAWCTVCAQQLITGRRCTTCKDALAYNVLAYNQENYQPVGEKLKLLGAKLDLVQQDMVVARPVGALNTGMAVQVEVELCGVADVPVNQSSCSTNRTALSYWLATASTWLECTHLDTRQCIETSANQSWAVPPKQDVCPQQLYAMRQCCCSNRHGTEFLTATSYACWSIQTVLYTAAYTKLEGKLRGKTFNARRH